MDTKCLSVVIPAYKAEKTIARTITSCFADPEVETQVVVIEDGVFDNTRAVIEGLDLPVTLITQEQNAGAQVARNLGLSKCEHDWVMFLDSDDHLEPPLLRGLIATAQQGDLDLVLGPMTTIDEQGHVLSEFTPPKNESRREILQRWLRGYSFPHPCGVLWKTQYVRDIGGWDERLKRNQDGEIILRALMTHAKVGTSQQGTSYYLDHSGPRVSKGASLATYEAQELILEMLVSWKSKDDEELKPAISEFCALVSAKAYNDGHRQLGKKWENRTKEFGGLKIGGFTMGGKKREMRLAGYKLMGIATTERLRRLIGV